MSYRWPEAKTVQEGDAIAIRVLADRGGYEDSPDYRRQCEACSQSAIRLVIDRPWGRPCTLRIVMHAPYWNDGILAEHNQVLLATMITEEQHVNH